MRNFLILVPQSGNSEAISEVGSLGDVHAQFSDFGPTIWKFRSDLGSRESWRCRGYRSGLQVVGSVACSALEVRRRRGGRLPQLRKHRHGCRRKHPSKQHCLMRRIQRSWPTGARKFQTPLLPLLFLGLFWLLRCLRSSAFSGSGFLADVDEIVPRFAGTNPSNNTACNPLPCPPRRTSYIINQL